MACAAYRTFELRPLLDPDCARALKDVVLQKVGDLFGQDFVVFVILLIAITLEKTRNNTRRKKVFIDVTCKRSSQDPSQNKEINGILTSQKSR